MDLTEREQVVEVILLKNGDPCDDCAACTAHFLHVALFLDIAINQHKKRVFIEKISRIFSVKDCSSV